MCDPVPGTLWSDLVRSPYLAEVAAAVKRAAVQQHLAKRA